MMYVSRAQDLWQSPCNPFYRLQYPGAPCLSVGGGAKAVWLPAEVCRVRRGQRKLKLDDRQTAEVRLVDSYLQLSLVGFLMY